jgi:glucosylceramidase
MRLVVAILSFTSILVLAESAKQDEDHHPFQRKTQSCAADGKEARVCNRPNRQAPYSSCCEGLVCSGILCVQAEEPSPTVSPSVSPTVSPTNKPTSPTVSPSLSLTESPSVSPAATLLECADPCIKVDETIEYQTFYGAGASLTESSASVLDGVSDVTRADMLEALFSNDTGIGLSLLRQPMGSSDFSLMHDTYWDDSQGTFSIDGDPITTIQDALKINPYIRLIGIPWSPPAWMKTSNSLYSGSLIDDAGTYSAFAQYHTNFVSYYTALGIDVFAVGIQNEPQHGANDYPSMIMTPTEHADAAVAIRHALNETGHSTVKLLAYDHNWDTPQYPLEVLANSAAYDAIDGIAFHCYGGSVSAQSQIKDSFPNMDIYFTECTESGNTFFEGDFRWAMKTLVIGAVRNWASTLFQWNLILDVNSGPKLPGGCSNCLGLLNCDDQDCTSFTPSPAYYAFGHLAKFVRFGAVRVDSPNPDRFTYSLAMKNPDGTGILLIFNDRRQSVSWNVEMFGLVCENVGLAQFSALTIVFNGSTVVERWVTNAKTGDVLLGQDGLVECATIG